MIFDGESSIGVCMRRKSSLHSVSLCPVAVTADSQACIEDGTVSQIVRQRTLAATAALITLENIIVA